MMNIRTLFEKQVFVRLTDDQTGFICTVRWPLLSLSGVRRAMVDEIEIGFAPQVTGLGSIAAEELPVLRRIQNE